MSENWKLYAIDVEVRRAGTVFVIASSASEATRAAEEQLEVEHLGDADEPEFFAPREFEITQKALALVARNEWAGPPYMADDAPAELEVDMNKLAAAFDSLQDSEPGPGTRAYQEKLEALGQLRISLDGAA